MYPEVFGRYFSYDS